jgi:hypothetical protein
MPGAAVIASVPHPITTNAWTQLVFLADKAAIMGHGGSGALPQLNTFLHPRLLSSHCSLRYHKWVLHRFSSKMAVLQAIRVYFHPCLDLSSDAIRIYCHILEAELQYDLKVAFLPAILVACISPLFSVLRCEFVPTNVKVDRWRADGAGQRRHHHAGRQQDRFIRQTVSAHDTQAQHDITQARGRT